MIDVPPTFDDSLIEMIGKDFKKADVTLFTNLYTALYEDYEDKEGYSARRYMLRKGGKSVMTNTSLFMHESTALDSMTVIEVISPSTTNKSGALYPLAIASEIVCVRIMIYANEANNSRRSLNLMIRWNDVTINPHSLRFPIEMALLGKLGDLYELAVSDLSHDSYWICDELMSRLKTFND